MILPCHKSLWVTLIEYRLDRGGRRGRLLRRLRHRRRPRHRPLRPLLWQPPTTK